MNIEETDKQKQIRQISEDKNPYAKECPNRHLWSEGFRNGYNFKIEEPDINTPFFGNSRAKIPMIEEQKGNTITDGKEHSDAGSCPNLYDENYLNECIAKAKPNLSKIKDVDKALDEIRGVEPSKVMDNDFIEKTQNDVDRAMELAIKKSGKKKPSKGAKEWLSKNYHEFMIHWRNTGRKDSFIFNMLEQYRAEGLREELNNFLRFYLNCPESSLWKAVDEYLKQKP